MPKRKRKYRGQSSQKKRRPQRVFDQITNRFKMLRELDLTEIQDKRRIPAKIKERQRIDFTTQARQARIKLQDRPKRAIRYTNLQNRLGFERPKKTITCIRRKQRRRTLFANKKIGYGKTSSKKRKFNESSKVRC